jgi:hypothetical protein
MGGCSSAQKSSTSVTPTKAVEETKTLSSKSIMDDLKKAGLPIGKTEIYTEENDTNKLLGRPNQYTEKTSWADTRLEQASDNMEGGTIEMFANQTDLQNRKTYVEAVTKSSSMLVQYIYAYKNCLMRLSKNLTPKQAEEYKNILEKCN